MIKFRPLENFVRRLDEQNPDWRNGPGTPEEQVLWEHRFARSVHATLEVRAIKSRSLGRRWFDDGVLAASRSRRSARHLEPAGAAGYTLIYDRV